MVEKENVVYIRLDNATYEALSLIVAQRKRDGQNVNLSDVIRELLQQATGNIEGERLVKFRDLEQLKQDLTKEYNKGIDRLAKLWWKSSRVIITMLLIFLDEITQKIGLKKVEERLAHNKKRAIAALKIKEDEGGDNA